MVVGFICEGQTEEKILKSPNFQFFLKSLGIIYQGTINTKGNGRLLPKFLDIYNKRLKDAWKIFIITDSDKNTIAEVYERIKPNKNLHILIIPVKKVESWFLSNDDVMRDLTGVIYSEYRTQKDNQNLPENIEELGNPYHQLKDIFKNNTELINTSKLGIATEITKQFNIQNSNCDSAHYFIEKLQEVSKLKPTSKKKRKKTLKE